MDRWIGFGRSLLVYNNPISRRAWRLFYEDLLAPGDVAFDIGAHVGTRARAMRAVGARVVAVEPQEPFATYLRRTLPGDIEVVPAAVGNLAGEREMAVSHRQHDGAGPRGASRRTMEIGSEFTDIGLR